MCSNCGILNANVMRPKAEFFLSFFNSFTLKKILQTQYCPNNPLGFNANAQTSTNNIIKNFSLDQIYYNEIWLISHAKDKPLSKHTN